MLVESFDNIKLFLSNFFFNFELIIFLNCEIYLIYVEL